MKNIVYFLFFVFTVILTANSCIKENKDSDNHFIHNGTIYKLDNGYIENCGKTNNGCYRFGIYLISSPNTQYNPLSLNSEEINNILYVEMNTSSADGLINGTYNFSNLYSTFTFTSAAAGINTDITRDGSLELEIAGGKIEVEIKEKEITLVLDLITKDDAKITGKYTGVLTLI